METAFEQKETNEELEIVREPFARATAYSVMAACSEGDTKAIFSPKAMSSLSSAAEFIGR